MFVTGHSYTRRNLCSPHYVCSCSSGKLVTLLSGESASSLLCPGRTMPWFLVTMFRVSVQRSSFEAIVMFVIDCSLCLSRNSSLLLASQQARWSSPGWRSSETVRSILCSIYSSYRVCLLRHLCSVPRAPHCRVRSFSALCP